MKKYVLLFKNEIENVLEFRVALFSRTALDVAVFYAAYVFWQVIYSENEIVKGLGFNDIKIYLLVTFAISVLSKSALVGWEIQKFVRTGELSNYLSKPMSTLTMVFVRSLGNTFVRLIVGLVLFVIFSSWCGVEWQVFELSNIFLGVVFLGFVVLLSFLIFAIIGCLSFWLISIRYIYFLFQELFRFLSGAYIPLFFFPLWFQRMSVYLPFRYLTDFPILIVLGRVSRNDFLLGLVLLLVWIVVLYFVLRKVWQLGLRKYEAVSG